MRIPALLGLLALATSAALPARASELTGSYAGTVSCKLAGAATSTVPSLIQISGPVAEIDGSRYTVRAAGGDASFARCGSINPAYGDRPNGFEEVTYATDAAGTATLHLASRSELGLCEATWTRIDARDPGIPACGQ